MSNAIVVPDTFKVPVAAAFAGQQAADDLSGGLTGGYGLLKYRGKVWSIQYQGNSLNLMRDDGDGPRGSVDIVILKANAQLSKTWYENGWDENSNASPDCASANGIVPDQDVPKKQSNVCATCPRNAWGSAANGGKGKVCGDHRRMAIVPLTDLRNERFGGPLLLRCPAASLQDLAAFNQRYHQMGYPYFSMGIKISFDPAKNFPKFQFAAIRPLTEAEAAIVIEMQRSDNVARVISEGTAPAPVQVQQAQPTFIEPVPPNAVRPTVVQPEQVAVQPVAQPAAAQPVQPAAVAQPAPALPTQPVGNGVAVPAATGFGPVAGQQPAAQPTAQPAAPANTAVAQPAVQPAAAAPAKPAVAMTGFGATQPEATQPAAAAAPATVPAGPAVTPGVVTAFEGSIDDRLSALIAGQ